MFDSSPLIKGSKIIVWNIPHNDVSDLHLTLSIRLCPKQKTTQNIINSHVISQFTFALPIWGANISYNDNRRLSSLLFKIIRLHCRDFLIYSWIDNCVIQPQLDLWSRYEYWLLYNLISSSMNFKFTLRLIQQTSFSPRFPNILIFFDFGCKRIVSTSFINHSKKISKLIPFKWHKLSLNQFKKKMKEATPIYIL